MRKQFKRMKCKDKNKEIDLNQAANRKVMQMNEEYTAAHTTSMIKCHGNGWKNELKLPI